MMILLLKLIKINHFRLKIMRLDKNLIMELLINRMKIEMEFLKILEKVQEVKETLILLIKLEVMLEKISSKKFTQF